MKRAARTAFVCQQCGHAAPRWLGQCPGCEGWGTFVEEAVPEETEAFSPQLSYVLVNMMKGVVQRGTGAYASRLKRPIAGKTGTSQDSKDMWFIGMTPDLTAGAWMGYDDFMSLPMKDWTGGGTVFGPKPRSYDLKVNRKVARKALAMALSDRAANGRVFVAAGLELSVPSTGAVEKFLVNLDCAAPVLIVTHDEPVVLKSVRNLPYAEASEVAALSTEQVLRARSLVLTEKAFAALNEA